MVVVAVDPGTNCTAAFERALHLFPKDSTTFHIVHLRPPQEDFFLATVSADFKRYSRQMEMRNQRKSKEVLDKFRALAEEAGINHVEVELTPGIKWWTVANHDNREVLCKYCESVGADTLVMSSQGNGKDKRA